MNNLIIKNAIKYGPAVVMGVVTCFSSILDVKKADEYKELVNRVAELEKLVNK